MQLYAFYVLALCALAARAATIPDNTQAAQESLQKLQESFNTQIDTLTENIETFLNGNRSNNVSPVEEQTNAGLQNIRSGLITFKTDFTKGVKILDDYIQFNAANQILTRSYPSSDSENMQTFITNFATNIQNGFATVTNSLNNCVIRDPNAFNQGQHVSIDSSVFVTPTEASAPASSVEASASVSSAEASAPMSSVEASVSVSSAAAPAAVPPAEILANGPMSGITSLYASQMMKFDQAYQRLLNAYNTCNEKSMQSAEGIGSQAKFTKTLLQDNPVNQRIAETVQNLDPEKPLELEKVKTVSDVRLSEDEKTELSSDSGDNNISGDDGEVKISETAKEVPKETLSEEVAEKTKKGISVI